MLSGQQDGKLIQLIYRSLENIEIWEDILQYLCEQTGATKAIITTREKPTANIVISETIQQMHESPLLYGLSNAEIESYVSTYREDDIWTAIENSRHPHVPYSLAQHLPLDELKQNNLWNWLEPQGISDSIVGEIFNTTSHWIAINIYYDHADKHIRRNIMDFLSSYLEEMQRAWRLGRELRSAEMLLTSGGVLIDHYDFAAILIAPPLKILWMNNQAIEVLAAQNIGAVNEGILRFSDKNIEKWIALHTKALFNHKNDVEDLSHDMNYSMYAKSSEIEIKINRMAKFDTVLGTGSPVFLVSVLPNGKFRKMTLKDMLSHPELTKTEKLLVQHLSQGNNIVSFSKARGTKEDAARHHWKNVKRKLGLFSHKQISTARIE